MPRPALLALLLPALITLAACDKPVSFDERYQNSSAEIRASANSMEHQVMDQLSAANEADRAVHDMGQNTLGSLR